MSDKEKAADVAKKAEEAIRNAEMLEKVARDAASAAAQAREEAEQAKAMAKSASKKKKEKAEEALASVKKAKSLASKEPAADKKFVLDYLQKNAFDLRKQIRNLYDISFADDPPRVVLEMVPGPGGPDALKVPELVHNGVKLEVEVKVKKRSAVMVGEGTADKITTEDEKAAPGDETYHRSITGKAAETLGITEALGPHSLDKAPKHREAYEAWLKRHPSVKVR